MAKGQRGVGMLSSEARLRGGDCSNLTASPPSVTACGGATSPARGEAFCGTRRRSPWGEGGPQGRMRGEKVGSITPVGILISLASLDSFPLKGGSLFA